MNTMEAVIFDLDGVLVDSEPRHERAFREVFQELGYSETHGMDFPAYYGRSDRVLWLDFVAKHQPAQTVEELAALKQRRFLDMMERDQPVFDGVEALVDKLARRYKLAVASGSYHPIIDAALALRNLRRYFSVTVSAQDVPYGKPAPDIFLRAAALLAVRPEGCCVIEDSSAGVEAALAAGMRVIGITNSLPREKLQRATHVVSSYQEIERLLLSSLGEEP